jgi:hypothetical protein
MIASYTTYDIATGEISSNITADEQTVLLNLSDSEGYIQGAYDARTQKIVNGVVVDKDTSAQDAERDYVFFIMKRNALLTQSDWTQGADSPLSDTQKQEWATYRQALRDLPQNTVDPANPIWPTKP